MADQRLQQLRRAWDEGDLETQVRLLRERMRAGELSEERLRLAAHLRDHSACELLGLRPPEEADVLRWLEGLGESGEVSRRAKLAAAWKLSREWDELAEERLLPALLEAADRQVVCPCPQHAHDFEAFLDTSQAGLSTGLYSSYIPAKTARAYLAAAYLAACAVSSPPPRFVRVPNGLRGKTPYRGFHTGWPCFVEYVLGAVFADDLRAAVRDELVPWALGLRDPVAERVVAREAST